MKFCENFKKVSALVYESFYILIPCTNIFLILGLKESDKYKNLQFHKGNGSNIYRGLSKICSLILFSLIFVILAGQMCSFQFLSSLVVRKLEFFYSSSNLQNFEITPFLV